MRRMRIVVGRVWLLAAAAAGVICSRPTARAQTCVTPASGLISWWQAQGNASDSADGNHGTLQGGVGFLTGEVGQAFDFDGTSAFVSVPVSANLNVGTQAGLTLECWIKPADVSARQDGAESPPIQRT